MNDAIYFHTPGLIAASLGKDRELQELKVGQDLLKKVSELVSKSAGMLADDTPF